MFGSVQSPPHPYPFALCLLFLLCALKNREAVNSLHVAEERYWWPLIEHWVWCQSCLCLKINLSLTLFLHCFILWYHIVERNNICTMLMWHTWYRPRGVGTKPLSVSTWSGREVWEPDKIGRLLPDTVEVVSHCIVLFNRLASMESVV